MKTYSELSQQSYSLVVANSGRSNINGTFHSQDLDLRDLAVRESTALESLKPEEAR